MALIPLSYSLSNPLLRLRTHRLAEIKESDTNAPSSVILQKQESNANIQPRP
jgi:hypothetical protein